MRRLRRAQNGPVNWARIKGSFGIVMQRWSRLRQRRLGRKHAEAAEAITRKADEKRLAEWLAREHKADPIHK